MYKKQLAFIHDRWYSDFALNAAKFVKDLELGKNGIMIDLGCGSGTFLEQFKDEKNALGVDISDEMIELSRHKLPHFDFRVNDILLAELPPAKIITMIGEILSYTAAFEELTKVESFLEKCFEALTEGGILLFDAMVQDKEGFNYEHITNEEDFFIYMKSEEKDHLITRKITSFLKQGESYSKDYEEHHQRLFDEAWLKNTLEKIGFKIEVMRRYGDFNLPRGRKAFLARKLL